MTHHPVEIFIAYSRVDTPFLENFRKQFSPLERRGRVKIWYDGEIVAGEVWESAIKAAIHKADIIMLLVSADSLASDYFYEQEVSNALARHKAGEAKVVPVILRACTWRSTELADLQALPKDGKALNSWTDTDEAYANVVEGILKIVEDHEQAIQKKIADSIKEEEAKKKQQKAEEEKASKAQQVASAKSNKEKTKKAAPQNRTEKPNASATPNTITTSPEFKIDTQFVLIVIVVLVIAFGLFKAMMWLLDGYLSSSNSSTEKVESIPDFKMVAIPAGVFIMGCTSEQWDCEDNEKPAHQVTLSSFYMGETEVTQALWFAVMGTRPSGFGVCDDCPVENVSWDDAQLFLSKLNALTGKNYRLPTEAEWEYAAREGDKAVMFGNGENILNPAEANFDASAAYKKLYSVAGTYRAKTTPVKTFKPNSLGLYDMAGNVWEWCSDWYGSDYYSKSPSSNPQGASSGADRVLRGGGWSDDSQYCRVAYRYIIAPGLCNRSTGFRLAASQ